MISTLETRERINFTIRITPRMKRILRLMAADEENTISNLIREATILLSVMRGLKQKCSINEIAKRTGLSEEEINHALQELKEIQWS